MLVLGGFAAACGAGHDAGPGCKSGAAGVDKGGELAPSLDAYCTVSIDGGAVVPNAEVTPYDVNTPLFSDYAVKFRTVWLPPSTSVSYNAQGRFEFPIGTVITKSFGFPADLRDCRSPGQVDRDARAHPGSGRLDGIELRLGRRAEGRASERGRPGREPLVHRRGGVTRSRRPISFRARPSARSAMRTTAA